MVRHWVVFPIVIALLCGLTGCLTWRHDGFSSDKPGKVLFERGIAALERHHYDVARLILQTPVNTYPESNYADKAQRLLEDPRIARCAPLEGMKWVVGSYTFDCSKVRSTDGPADFGALTEPDSD